MTLAGKYVLITGAARRLGRVMALAAAKAGANVIIHHGHSAEEALELQREIEELGQTAVTYQADFLHQGEVHDLIQEAFQHQPLFALINNAAIFGNLTWKDTSLTEWNDHIQINLTVPFLLSQAFANHLPQQGEGRIINMLDWRALRPRGDHFPYTISKAALASMTKSLAASLAPRIIVNGIALGAILPPADQGSNDTNKVIHNVPAQRWSDLQELEEMLLFLLTGPSYMTGEIIHLDGGRHLI